VVLQVSRWDRLKDPIGFLRIYAEHLTDREDVHLVHAGPATNGVGDDPEGADVVEACAEVWRSFEPSVQERVHLLEVPMSDIDENAVIVNAMQCRADVVVQKSLEEGFGLTVAEAMWKSRPVVASRVGGIQDQIEHDRSGLLVDDPYDIAAFATAVRSLLDDPDRAARLGSAAHDRVCDHFLGPRQLEQYADLLVELAHGERAA
jgi:trehalose synthase